MEGCWEALRALFSSFVFGFELKRSRGKQIGLLAYPKIAGFVGKLSESLLCIKSIPMLKFEYKQTKGRGSYAWPYILGVKKPWHRE